MHPGTQLVAEQSLRQQVPSHMRQLNTYVFNTIAFLKVLGQCQKGKGDEINMEKSQIMFV